VDDGAGEEINFYPLNPYNLFFCPFLDKFITLFLAKIKSNKEL
jgi:hypothetical protein